MYLRALDARIDRASAGLHFRHEPQRSSEPAQLKLAIWRRRGKRGAGLAA